MKLLLEDVWDDDNDDGLSSIDPDVKSKNKAQMLAHKQADDAINSLDNINQYDKVFDKLYKDVLSTIGDNQIFSAKVQRFELKNFSKSVQPLLDKKDPNSDEEKLNKDIQSLLNNDSNDILKIFNTANIQNNRKDLYELYDEVADINPIVYRMLRVYIDNILVKNMQTKQFLNVARNLDNDKMIKYDQKVIKQIEKIIELILVYFNIQRKFKNDILPKTLKYGDYYIEVINLDLVDKIIGSEAGRKQIISENIVIPDDDGNKKIEYKNVNLGIFEFSESFYTKAPFNSTMNENHDTFHSLNHDEKINYNIRNLKKKISQNPNIIEEFDMTFLKSMPGMDDLSDKKEKNDELDLNRILDLDMDVIDKVYLKHHDPSNVLKIERDGVLFGYLIIEDLKDKNKEGEEINLYKRFMDDNNDGGAGKNGENDKKIKDATDVLTTKVMEKISQAVQKDSSFLDSLNDDLKASLRIIIYEKIKEKAKLKFRFLEPKDIINFHTNIDKFSPYGTSIFDPVIQPVKMYTVALMASIISRLSRASVIRKWNIEVGNKRNYSEVVEKVKKDIKNKTITYDDLGSIKNVAQILSDYRDIATVTMDGNKFIDLEIMPTHDRALPINDLQDLKNELIAATGVPSVYLNVGDSVDLRETLVNLNIGFANTILTLQSFQEDALNELMNSIFNIILKLNGMEDVSEEFNISQYFKINLNPPLVLELQSNESMITSVANIIGTLTQTNMKVDPKTLLETYIPNINWDNLLKNSERNIKDQVKENIMQQQAGGDSQGGF